MQKKKCFLKSGEEFWVHEAFSVRAIRRYFFPRRHLENSLLCRKETSLLQRRLSAAAHFTDGKAPATGGPRSSAKGFSGCMKPLNSSKPCCCPNCPLPIDFPSNAQPSSGPWSTVGALHTTRVGSMLNFFFPLCTPIWGTAELALRCLLSLWSTFLLCGGELSEDHCRVSPSCRSCSQI